MDILTQQEWKIGDCLELIDELDEDSIDLIVTSPPYWGLRDYGVDGQIGLERSLKEYHTRLLEVTAECIRVLKPTGVMFWNHGDSYGGSGGSGGDYNKGGLREGQPKVGRSHDTNAKCLTMQNERLIIRMIDEQHWILRNRIIWNKPNGMPSSVTDRFSNNYEPVYMLVKSKHYWFNLDAVRKPYSKNTQKRYQYNFTGNKIYAVRNPFARSDNEKIRENPLGKNPGDVWAIPTQSYPESHFATFPSALIKLVIKAACPENGTVLDPFCGSGTVLEVCRELNRNAIGFELNPEYELLIKNRCGSDIPQLTSYF